ncbi:MAG: hypothetical protein ACJA09_001311 [Alcanivorax sp.]|jgi:hypothetical protein
MKYFQKKTNAFALARSLSTMKADVASIQLFMIPQGAAPLSVSKIQISTTKITHYSL